MAFGEYLHSQYNISFVDYFVVTVVLVLDFVN